MTPSILLLFILSSAVVAGQNLVPNPSFETVDCQTGFTFPFGCTIVNNPPWVQPGSGSSDSFNVCHSGDFGNYQVPVNFQGSQAPLAGSGDGYAGVMTFEDNGIEYREYIQVALASPLEEGAVYELGFFCSLADNATYASDGLAMLLTVGAVSGVGQGLISGDPQLAAGVMTNSNGWTQLSGLYEALGGESHLTIGNFYSDSQTTTSPTGQGSFERAFYYVDEVHVQLVQETDLAEWNASISPLTITPNPATHYIQVKKDATHIDRLQVFDALGRDRSAALGVHTSSADHVRVDVSGLEAGVYILIVDGKRGTFVKGRENG